MLIFNSLDACTDVRYTCVCMCVCVCVCAGGGRVGGCGCGSGRVWVRVGGWVDVGGWEGCKLESVYCWGFICVHACNVCVRACMWCACVRVCLMNGQESMKRLLVCHGRQESDRTDLSEETSDLPPTTSNLPMSKALIRTCLASSNTHYHMITCTHTQSCDQFYTHSHMITCTHTVI